MTTAMALAAVLVGAGCPESGPGPATPSIPVADPGGAVPGPDGSADAPSGDAAVESDPGPGPDRCGSPADCDDATPHCGASGFCLECLYDDHCPDDGEVCTNGRCASSSCEPGETVCDGHTLRTCRDDGSGWDPFFCVGGQCLAGACKGCEPEARVCRGSATVMACDAEGEGFTVAEECAEGDVCAQGACLPCFPGARRCTGQVAERCTLDEGWIVAEDCASGGRACSAGTCLSPCAQDLKLQSNTGCDYWAVDLDNHYAAQDGPFAVIVSNLSQQPSTVTITRRDGPATSPEQLAEETVAPGELEVFRLPQGHLGGAGIAYRAFRVQSTSPIIAVQFNPLANVDVFSNDASLLIPEHTYGTEYIAVSRAQFTGAGPKIPAGESCQSVCQGDGLAEATCVEGLGCVLPYRGTLTVVGPGEQTEVTVRPTARTLAGGGIEAMSPPGPYTFTLDPYQVLNIKSDEDGGDLTGTVVTSDAPVAVFSGHESAASSEGCCTDHLEQQMFPVRTWGTEYLATKSFPRGAEEDYWRVVAAEDGTEVSFTPEVSGPRSLDRGEFFEVASREDFRITASAPVAVAQILAGSGEILTVPVGAPCDADGDCSQGYVCEAIGSGAPHRCLAPRCVVEGTPLGCPQGHTCFCADGCVCEPVGDPALVSMPPLGQFRTSYVFLTPDAYQDDYVNVIAPAAASVTVDDEALVASAFDAIPGTDFKVARLRVTDGVHRVASTLPVGVVVYGYDRDVSYGYTAGLNLSDL